MYLIETPFYKANIKPDGTFKVVPKLPSTQKKKSLKDPPRYKLMHSYENKFKKSYSQSLSQALNHLLKNIKG